MKKQSGKKLVEILAVELKEWADTTVAYVQDGGEGCTWPLVITDPVFKDAWGTESGYGDFIDHSCNADMLVLEIATDYKTAIVTRSQWEAERAKLSKPKANVHGWVRNRGRKNPFDVCTLVDARLRSGDVVTGKFSENLHWVHTGNNFDVMAYRVNESVEAAAPEVTAPVDGPLQWRDRIAEIDRNVEALEEERASLIQKLADEGFKLIKREAVEMPDPKDQSTWLEGMEVEIVHSDNGCWADRKGMVGKLTLQSLISKGHWVIEFDGCSSWAVNDNTEIKFVARPAK